MNRLNDFDMLLLDESDITPDVFVNELKELQPDLSLLALTELHMLSAQNTVASLSQWLHPWNVALSSVTNGFDASTRCVIPQTAEGFENAEWIGILFGIQKDIEAIGRPKKFAQGMVGAIEEMVSNSFQHSENLPSAFIAVEQSDFRFSFVIADAGIGLRKSLNSRGLQNASDDGHALELALTEGVSKFGTNVGQGNGFRQLLRSLQSHGCVMRFRTGNARLTISGSTGEHWNICDAIFLQGFLVGGIIEKF